MGTLVRPSPGRSPGVRRWGAGVVALGQGRSEDQDDDHEHHDHGSGGDGDGEDRVEEDENGSGGTTALTMRSALSRMAIHQVPRTKIVIGTVTVKEAATSLSLLWLVRTSISTSMPADRAPAAAKTK